MRDTDGALQVAEQLPPDMMLLKMENDQIFSVARAQPRDPMKIVEQLRALVDAYPAAAEEAIYSKPVGTVTEVTCPDKKCGITFEVNKIDQDTVCPACEGKVAGKRFQSRKVKKFAEGLSIRAAESIRSIYGYTRLATTMVPIEDDKVKLSGTLVDYAAGNLTSDERVVSPWYKSRGGTMVKTPEDRFYNVVVKAEKSKLRRDIILDNTPSIVKALFRDCCEQKMLTLVADEVIQQKVIPAFGRYGITPEQLDKLIGKPAALGWSDEDRLELRKILNALKNEETTVRELLDGLGEQPQPQVPDGGASVNDLLPPESQPDDYASEFANAKTKTECDAIAAALVKRASETEAAAILDAREAAKKRIGNKRGPRSNKKKPEGPSVLDAAIAELRECSSAQEARALTAEIAERPEIQALPQAEQERLAEVALEMESEFSLASGPD